MRACSSSSSSSSSSSPGLAYATPLPPCAAPAPAGGPSARRSSPSSKYASLPPRLAAARRRSSSSRSPAAPGSAALRAARRIAASSPSSSSLMAAHSARSGARCELLYVPDAPPVQSHARAPHAQAFAGLYLASEQQGRCGLHSHGLLLFRSVAQSAAACASFVPRAPCLRDADGRRCHALRRRAQRGRGPRARRALGYPYRRRAVDASALVRTRGTLGVGASLLALMRRSAQVLRSARAAARLRPYHRLRGAQEGAPELHHGWCVARALLAHRRTGAPAH